MPTANFEYYTEGAKNKIALAGKPVKFKDLSKGAFSIKWTFPDGETLTDKEVIRQFKYSGIYKIKLEAFSRRGDLVNEKIIYCEVFSTDNPADYVKVKIIFEGDERIKITGTPLLETPTVRPSWCKNLEECTWFVFKGTQPYSIFGAAINYINQNHCELHGSGSIEFVDGATYRIFYTDVSTCTMKMERVANGY